MHVVTMVLAAGVFIGILSGSGMSEAMGTWLAEIVPVSMGSHWALVVALASVPGTFMLSNDAFYLGVLPVLAQTGAGYGFTPMQIALASTTGQAFHLLSPLVGFIYLLLHLTGVDMGAWQRLPRSGRSGRSSSSWSRSPSSGACLSDGLESNTNGVSGTQETAYENQWPLPEPCSTLEACLLPLLSP